MKRTGARPAGRDAACNDFIPTACVCNMRTWGGPSTFIWMWAKRGGHGLCGEDLGGASLHARKDEPFIFYNSCPGPSMCTWRELETGPYNTAESEWGPYDWSVLSPMAVHRDKRTTSRHAGTFVGGLRGTGRGSTYMEAQQRAANGQPKVNGGHATGAC